MQYREFTSRIVIDDNTITIDSTIQSFKVSTSITRGGSEDTDFAAAMVSHKATALGLEPTSTSPPIAVTQYGKWVAQATSSTVTSATATLKVPPLSTGQLQFVVDTGSTLLYSQNGGSFTSFSDATIITVADGDTLALRATGLVDLEAATGRLIDVDSGRAIDGFSLLNNTPAP